MNDRKSIHQAQSTSLNDIVQPSPLRRRLAILTLIAYIGQPIAATAEIIAAQNAAANQRPTVDATANGLPLVQIATPSAAGVSHNQYSTFNVDPSGAILNNSAAAVSTQQAGYVVGNPNLVNGSARIILNEVTSANRSQLNGYTEVAGQRAEVIIANPNGITCNGCGFINTSRGVLTTGTPVMGVGGSLDAYRVTGGDIQIGASGLNGSNLDQLDLISRSLKVNGEIWANNLNAITGTNQVNHADLGVQLITGDANKPTVGIDVALLGGMYANKIHLVGTEAGVGVSSAGTLAAQAGDFTLDTQGQITLTGNTTASGNLTLNSAAGINNSGTLDSRHSVQMNAAGDIANSGALTAQNNLTLNAATLNSNGTLGAGIDGNGNASQPGNITLTTQNQATATGTNLAGSQITINGSAINLGGSFTSARQDVNLTAGAGNIDLNNAQTQSLTGNVNLTANGTISNDNGLLLATQITATGTNLSNRNGQIGAQRIAMTGNLLDNSSGLVQAAQLDFTLNNLTNRAGGIRQTGTQPLTAIIIGNVLDNTGGWIQSDSDDFTVGANTLTNDNAGQIVHTGQGTLAVNATGTLSNNSGLISSQGNTRIGAGSLSNQGGVISATGSSDITSQSTLDNSASGYIGASALTLTASNGAVNNTGGKIEADAGLTLDAQSLTNSGGAIKVLSATDAQSNPTLLKITTTQDIINNAINGVAGFIGSNGQLILSSAALNNDGGNLYSNKNLVLITSAALSNQSGFIQTDSDLSVTATGALNNQRGTFEANGTSSLFSLTAASIDNTLGGRIANSGTGLTTLNGGSQIDNDGTLGGNGDLNLNAGIFSNTAGGVTFAGNDLTLAITGSVNNSGGNLYAANNLSLNQATASLNNTGGNISSGGTLTLNVADLNNQNGQVQTNADLALDTSGALSNAGGLISSQGNTRIGAGSLSNQGGVISVTGNGDISSQSTLDNSGGAIKVLGTADAQNNPTLLRIIATQDLINNALNGVAGFIGSNGQLILGSAALNNDGGKLYSNKNLVLTTSAALSNQSGFIQTDSDLSVTATGALNNQRGTFEANGTSSLFSLTAASIDNTLGGRIANSGTGLTAINGGSRIDNDGTLGARGDLILSAGLLNNTTSNAWIQSGGTLNLNVSGTLNNDAGAIYAAQALQLNQTSANVNNTNGGEISSSGDSTINVATVNNAGGNILAGNSLSLTANRYTGAGRVAAGNSNTITLQGDFTYGNGNVFASDGNMTIAVTGTLTNTVVMQALGTLTIKAANINNQAAGHFNSNRTDLQATNGAITNYGTIEGNSVLTSSQTLNNYATIIGDIVTLSVGDTLLNSGGNALLASTTQMNLWVSNLLHNTDGAEIFSMRDLNIAKDGTRDGAGNLTNLTGRVWNEGNSLSRSSLIEAFGNINIGAVDIDNARPTIGVFTEQAITTKRYTPAPAYVKDALTGAYTQSGTLTSSSAPIQAGIFAQDISNLDTVNKTFTVAGGDPISGAPMIAYQGMSATAVAATQYSGTISFYDTNVRRNVLLPTTQVIKDADIVSSQTVTTTNNRTGVVTTKINVTLTSGAVLVFNKVDRQGMYYDVAYYPGYDPAVHTLASDLMAVQGPSSMMYERWRDLTTTTTTQTIAPTQPREARIVASNNINIKLGGTLHNYVSTMAALNDFSINGAVTNGTPGGAATQVVRPAVGTINNEAITLTNSVSKTGTADLLGIYTCSDTWGLNTWTCYDGAQRTTAPQLKTTAAGGLASNLTAGGTLSAHVAKSFNQASGSNTTVTGSTLAASTNNTQVTSTTEAIVNPLTESRLAPSTVTAQSELSVGAGNVSAGFSEARQGQLAVPSANITLPTNGLYSIRPQPDQQYLVVTDPRFANYKEFVSSDYMLNRLTLDPQLTQKRLGDGFYEQRLINEQILDQTGRNVIGQYTSAEEQIKALMDSGVAAAKELKLTPGISLSAEQVASLQNDIVWMEVNRVTMADGNTVEVLVPKLYLTQLHKNDLSPDGALFAASLIDLNVAGEITNTGKIESAIATRMQGKDIFNQGTLSSAGDMMLKADNDITNRSGTITANNLWLDAGRDLLNTTATQTVGVGNASLGASNTLIGSTGTINARNNLSMKSGRDFTITGSLIEAGGNARLSAGGNLYMNTLQAQSSTDSHASNFDYSTRQITNLGSTIRTGGSLSMTAAKDMQLTAAKLDIGKNALIAADGNLSVVAAKDSSRLESAATNDAGNYSKLRTYDETVVGSSINANGNITLRAGSFANPGNARGGIERNGDPAQASTGKVATKQRDDAEHTESSQERIASNNGSEVMLQPQITENRQLSIGLVEQKGLVVGIERQIEGKPNMTGDEPGQPYENKPVAETKQAAVTETITQPAPQYGGNLTLQSVAINSTGGQVNLIAANDVNIGVTEEMHDYFSASHTSTSGFLSKSSTTKRNENHQTLAVGSDISGESVLVKAGNAADKTGNINVIGGSIVGTNDVTLDAGNDLSIKAATSTSTSSRYSRTTESGLMSNGGLSISIGSRETTEKADSVNSLQSQNRSMVGSLNGNLNLKAGNKALISGSDILAGNDMNIAAMDITINSGLDDSTNTQSRDTKQSGLTLAITSNVTDAAQTAQQMKDAGSKSKDPRIKAMAAAAAALAVQNAASQGASASVSLTYGSSQSHSDSTQTSQQRSGSTLKAGGNLNLIATGGGESSNITIQGSDINAGQDISLEADNKINLLADKNVNDQVSHNSSSSSGAGVGITLGSGGGSFGITANASMARGNIDGTDTTYTNTHLTAGKALKIKSGGDTNMIGATANGQQVIADIGGDLNIESLQDTSTYDTKQQSASGSATVGVGGASASLSLNQSTINGNFASVSEQSGLKAGDGGFQINVKGNTDLKGAVIESSQAAVEAGNNSLSTATLTTSDIENKSEYKAQSISVSGGTGGIAPPMVMQAADEDTSTTRSGISGGAVKITDAAKQKQLTGQDAEETVASLNRDVATGQDTSGAINNNLDVDQVQGAMAVTQAFVQQANTFMADMATKSERLKKAGDAKQTAADNEKDPARKAQLQAEANDLHQQSQDSAASSAEWAPGSTKRQILTAITAAAGGNVTGGTSQLVQSATVNYLQSLGATEVKKIADSLKDANGNPTPASESVRAALHGITACAGAAAQGADCSSGALGASAGSALNSILQGDTSKMSAEEKENRKNLVATLVTGIAASTEASNIATATNAAVMETENNWLSPIESLVRQKARNALAANPDDAEAKRTIEALDNQDEVSKQQMDDLLARGKKGESGAYTAAGQIIDDRNAEALAQLESCPAPYNCQAIYKTSDKENAEAAVQLPTWGSGEATPMADPITAVVMLRLGIRTPVVSGIGAIGAGAGEAANQRLNNGEVNNYEKIGYSAMGAWSTGPIAASVNGVWPLAVLSGTTNAGVTAYNNSQQGSNDSVEAAFGFGMLGGTTGVYAGKLSSSAASRTMTTTVPNQQYNPNVGVLLSGPSRITVPNQEAIKFMNMLGGTTGQAGVSALIPAVPSDTH